MKEWLKRNYQFSDYQIAQLGHLCKTLFSEISKLLIMAVIFCHKPDIYLVSVTFLLLLRTATGGLHCKTYLTCLLASFTYMFFCIELLPLFQLPFAIYPVLLCGCIPVNYILGPVTSDIHVPLTETRIKKGRIRAALIILILLIFTCIYPNSKYTVVCFWITIVHSLQLLYAKIRKKGAHYETEINCMD